MKVIDILVFLENQIVHGWERTIVETYYLALYQRPLITATLLLLLVIGGYYMSGHVF